MTTSFAHLGLPKSLVHKLATSGIGEPFPVQAATIPDALAGKDVSGRAPTGSGKTLAFGLPLLARVERAERNRPRALILSPTRELAQQIMHELAPLGRAMGRSVFAVYGGVGYGPQKAAMRNGTDVLVATPGRLEDLIEQRIVDLRQVEIVVVDEADRMADMGFLPAVRRILDGTSNHRQTSLFSATLDGDIAVLSRDYQTNPVRHEAGSVEPETGDAQHHFWLTQADARVKHTADLIEVVGRSIVFTRTRRGADRLAKQLSATGVNAVAMHGGRSQSQRDRALKAFSSNRVTALVATDVAARGIHVDSVAAVVHFDPPADAKDYLHRSGRTARAGAAGTVVSLVTGDKKRAVKRMQHELGLNAPFETPNLDAIESGGQRIQPRRRDNAGNPRSSHVRPTDAPRRTTEQRAQRRPSSKQESIYVGNLSWQTTEADLVSMFRAHGKVLQTTIVMDRKSGRSKGFGFVDISGSTADAVEALNGAEMGGRSITVRMAKPRQPKRQPRH